MVNQVSSSNYNYSVLANDSAQHNNTTFNGNVGRMFAEKSKQAAKTLTLSACLAAGLSCSNPSDDKISSQGDVLSISDNQNVTCLNVKPETRDIVVNTLTEYRRSLKGKDFLEDVDVVVVDKFDNLSDDDEFFTNVKRISDKSNTKGVSFYSDGAMKKYIVVQEKAHSFDRIINLIKKHKYSCENTLKHSLMHEVGHQFDSYFGHNHNEKFAKNWDNLLAEMAADSLQNPFEMPKRKEDIKTKLIYQKYNGLSDKNAFQEAILLDLQNIAKIKQDKTTKLPSNIEYFLTGINFSKEITPRIVDLADFCRSEVYANLFSYANGQDDGNREKFIKVFENSYKVVQKDIEIYLK